MASAGGPDKGHAWVIAFAACFINAILSGISRSTGILYVTVLNEYGVSREEATMPFIVRNSIRGLAGPLVGLAGQRYGIRAITFYGGLFTTIGACLCSLASDILWLTVLWGVLHGVGFAFTNTLSQVIVNQYFKKHRATASGIALSGACVSALVLPFAIEKIVSVYSLSGGFLILAGIIMHVLPPSLLLCPPSWTKKSSKDNPKQTTEVTVRPKDGIVADEKYKTCNDKTCEVFHLSCSQGPHVTADASCLEVISVNNAANENNLSNGNMKIPYDEKRQVSTKASNAFLSTSVGSIVRLFMNPFYVLISIGLASYCIIYIPLLTVIVDYSNDKGIRQSDGKYLINSLAVGDLIGRLCFGWVTDRGYMTIPKFFALTSCLQALFIALLPTAVSFPSFMILLWFYGVVSGSMLILFPLLVLKYISEDQQPIAMGSVSLLSAVLSFGQPRLIGHFRDDIGSYDGLFYLTGCISFLTGVLWYLEPILTRRLPKTNEQKTGTS